MQLEQWYWSQMRICDLKEDQIKLGMRIRSLVNPNKLGTIVEREDIRRDDYWWIQWDGDTKKTSGFFFNMCSCEVVEE